MTEIMQNKTDSIGALLIRPAINISALTPEQRTALGYELENGTGILEQDYELARLTYLSAAADGNAIAMNNLGWLYHNGMGVEADDDKARSYFAQAADKGCTIAMINLGNVAEDAEDYEEAYRWYRMAYILGDHRGQYNYANMYYWGWYVPVNYEFAFRLFYEIAYDWDDPEACWNVGHMLQEGMGIDKDEERGANWFAHGEKLGDAYCATELGRCYCLGLGVEQDAKKGLHYYNVGAERGDSLAYANLGYAYETGQGVTKSQHLALYYYEKGAALGEEHCIEAVERLKPADKSDDEIFLGHIGEIGKDLRRVADILMHCANAIGIKTSYSNGPLGVYTTAVFNIAPRNRAHEEYVRLEHKVSKLSVTNRLSEKRVEELFQQFKDDRSLDDKAMSFKRGYVYLDMQVLTDDEALRQYIAIIREISKSHLKPRTKFPTAEELWEQFGSIQETTEEPQEDDDYRNEIVEEALSRLNNDPDEDSLQRLYDAILDRIQDNAKVLIPIEPDTDENGEAIIHTLVSVDADGKHWMPVFTSMEEATRKETKDYLVGISWRQMLKMALDMDDTHGIVLNLYGDGYKINRETITVLRNAAQ